ncbi:MAG: tyrosine-type recombinase/integrase [Actinobacteria bacterium]|nr:tyrosine-type recombinase/integrase [Actinomycetota bacterium]
MKISESFELYLKYLKFEKNLTLNSINSYKKDIRQFVDFISRKNKNEENEPKNKDEIEISELNLLNFRQFLKFIDNYKYSNNTILRKYSSLCNYFKFLENNGIIKEPLSQYIDPPKKQKRLYSFLSQREIYRMLDCIDTSTLQGLRDRAIIEFIYSTGSRVSEVENIKIPDIDIENNEAKVFGKGRKYRIVYLNSEARFWIVEYFKKRNELIRGKSLKKNINLIEKHVFLNCFGNKLSSRSIRTIVLKYAKKSGIDKKISPHGIRHSFATHLLQEGAGIREIQELLGHENISTTQIYTHLNIKKMRQDYEKYHPREK